MMRSKASLRVALVGAAACAMGLMPGESPPPQKSDQLDELVTRLGADEYARREQATRSIIALGPGVADRLEACLSRADDPEVRYRLRYILENIVPPDEAVLLVRAAPETGLEPGDLITHVNFRRVRGETELRQRMANNPVGLLLRVNGVDGPREVGPVTIQQLIAMQDYRAPRGQTLSQVVRLFARGYAEQAYELLNTLDEPIPAGELSTPLHARIAYVAGDATTARALLDGQAMLTDRIEPGSDWDSPSLLDVLAPGRAPYHLEWWLFTEGGPPLYETHADPDLRVQRVLVPANRFADALRNSATMWWTSYRKALGSDQERETRIAGNMLAVSSWMLSELELLSECMGLVEPRSAILRRAPGGIRKWIRVRTDAWLPFIAGDERAALDGFYDDARGVLQRPREDVMVIRNPRVAAALAFFLYQFPDDERVAEMLRIVNHPGQPGLPEYVRWMTYALSESNASRVREHLAAVLPTFSDEAAAPVARAVALLEYVQARPDDDVMATARHRLAQSPDTDERELWLTIVDCLRALSADRPAAARENLAATDTSADPLLGALRDTIDFRIDPPPGVEDHAALRAPLLAIPEGADGQRWIVLARDRRLMRYDAAAGTLEALPRPTPTWFPNPLTWPWLGREPDTGRVWVYARRRVLELSRGATVPLHLNIRTEEIPDFARHVAPFFSTLAQTVADVDREDGENGEFLREQVQANAEYTSDPDLPEIALIEAVAPGAGLVHLALRGGPHVLIEPATGRSWTSDWLAERLGLSSAPTFSLLKVPPDAEGLSPAVFLASDQGLIRFEPVTETLERVALPGDEPFPPLVPEDCPYERHDPRWVYCARLPDAGGIVYRLRLEDGRFEQTDMINEALPPEYYRLRTRAELRRQLDAVLAESGVPPLAELVDDAATTVKRWEATQP